MKLITPTLLLMFAALCIPLMLTTNASAHSTNGANTQGKASKEQPSSIAYLTSWQLPENAVELLRKSKADAYMLSFAKWDENGKISSSDNIVKKPAMSEVSIPLGYLTWTQIAHFEPQTHMIISFGGQDYEHIWDTMGSPEHSKVIASNIAKLLTTDFPVYRTTSKQSCTGTACNKNPGYEIIGHTQLSGVDFDFEQASRLTPKQNQQLALLATQVRELVGNNKSIVLTTYHVGADPLNCKDPQVSDNCSFSEPARSSHHGEVLGLLESTTGLFDFYNVMTYDAGRNFDYKVAMKNYFNAVGNRPDLRLGISINQQWGHLGRFVMPLSDNRARAKWQTEDGYGGFFVWALGASSEDRSLDSQIRVFNSLVDMAAP